MKLKPVMKRKLYTVTLTGILTVSNNGLALSGVGRNIMIYITDNEPT